MDITTREAHELTGYSESHLRSLARDRRVLARKSGGIWLYDQEVLRLYATGEWVGIREAGELTGYSHDHLRSLARTKRVEALKIREFWLLHRRALLDYPAPQKERRRTRPTVFVSYSHKDRREKDTLLSHLGVLAGDDLINLDVWTDDRIPAGADWEAAISGAINKAQIAILLISANFLSSEFIIRQEVPKLLRYRDTQGLTIIPVIARACAWRRVRWLRRMQVRPKNGRPIWRNGGNRVDTELAAIADEVADIVERGGR
jgi:hypothetical protein